MIVEALIKNVLVSQRPVLLRFAFQRVYNVDDAEDVVGRVNIIALQSVQKFNREPEPGTVLNWLFGITVKVSAEIREDRERINPYPDDHACFALLADTDKKEWVSADLANDARQRMRLAKLNDNQRNCLVLKLEGKKRAEIAAELGMPPDSVKSNLQRAVAAMRAVPDLAIPELGTAEYVFKIGKEAVVYRSPTKVGAALAREKLARLK